MTVLKEKQHLLHQLKATVSHRKECFTAAKRDRVDLILYLRLTALSCTFLPYSYLSQDGD